MLGHLSGVTARVVAKNFLPSILLVVFLSGCIVEDGFDDSRLPQVRLADRTPVTYDTLFNEEATIPPQCYTKTEGVHNPCYVCHQAYEASDEYRMNKLNDGGIQGGYMFSEIGVNNYWSNLFVDRTDWLSQVSDEVIKEYIEQDNYSALAPRLLDVNWQGYVPDLTDLHLSAAAFDSRGLAKDASGWVAFNYKPLPSTFWPTNGSTDDVMIRLPLAFRTLNGSVNNDVYLLNLALTELTIKRLNKVDVHPFDEAAAEIDINGDGKLEAQVSTLVARTHYIGDAKNIEVPLQQFPLNTEFLHSVRYVGVDGEEGIKVPARMKELRYMRKQKVLSNDEVEARYNRERKEKLLEELPYFTKLGDEGFDNGMGWVIQGFIEDYSGDLRPQTHEEMFFCMGCHSAIGATIDQTFSFARKVTGPEGWGYVNLKGMKDAPSVSQDQGEILQYLTLSHGGNEFRENDEMLSRWFNEDGSVNTDAVKAADVYTLVAPSQERALKLNKAYTHIVRHQSYVRGRDATWSPALNVLKTVDESEPPLSSENRLFGWDMRLDWSR